MNNYIRLTDGGVILIAEVEKQSSIKSLILNDFFIELCEIVAKYYYTFPEGSEEYKTLVNLLFLKSNKLRTIAAIIEFERKNKVEFIDYEINLSIFSIFFSSKNISFFAPQKQTKSWINKSERFFFRFEIVSE